MLKHINMSFTHLPPIIASFKITKQFTEKSKYYKYTNIYKLKQQNIYPPSF